MVFIMIQCENLVKLFDSNSGVKNINLQFSPGIIYGIIGYNGAGKTTLLNCIEGLYIPTSGNVYHNNIKTTDEKEFLPYRRKISFVPSDDYLYPKLTCRENLELATILRTGKNKILKETEELITYFETDTFLHKKFKDCSTGMRKKIQIIISLIGEIDTIIWDEPNDGLDIISNIKIKNLLNYYKSKNITILFSAHVIEFLDNFVDYYILLKDGEVIEKGEAKGNGSLEKLYLKHINNDNLSLPFDSVCVK
jgi:ABC-type multidrug transport system ATPase subunit